MFISNNKTRKKPKRNCTGLICSGRLQHSKADIRQLQGKSSQRCGRNPRWARNPGGGSAGLRQPQL